MYINAESKFILPKFYFYYRGLNGIYKLIHTAPVKSEHIISKNISMNYIISTQN